jgi:hypothetical protein
VTVSWLSRSLEARSAAEAAKAAAEAAKAAAEAAARNSKDALDVCQVSSVPSHTLTRAHPSAHAHMRTPTRRVVKVVIVLPSPHSRTGTPRKHNPRPVARKEVSVCLVCAPRGDPQAKLRTAEADLVACQEQLRSSKAAIVDMQAALDGIHARITAGEFGDQEGVVEDLATCLRSCGPSLSATNFEPPAQDRLTDALQGLLKVACVHVCAGAVCSCCYCSCCFCSCCFCLCNIWLGFGS